MDTKVKYGLSAIGVGIVLTIMLFIGNNAGWFLFTQEGAWRVLAMLIAGPTILTFAVAGLYAWGGNSFVQALMPLLALLGILVNLIYWYIIGIIVYKLRHVLSK